MWSKKAQKCDDGMHIHKHIVLKVERLGTIVHRSTCASEYIRVHRACTEPDALFGNRKLETVAQNG